MIFLKYIIIGSLIVLNIYQGASFYNTYASSINA